MTDGAAPYRKQGLLISPTYAHIATIPRRPTFREVCVEWVDAVSFWRNPLRGMAAFYAAYHLATFCVFVLFFVRYFSLLSIVSVVGLACMSATVYNTVWYHRYCSHRAFKFRNIWWVRFFLWTNPICFREESYVIPHRVHHSKSDEAGDPYGPHLGWFGSYMATESQQKMNPDISRADYDRLAKSLEHTGIVKNSYEQYQRTGSVEKVWHYFARVLFVNIFWPAICYLVAGWAGALAWISSVFLYSLVVRDFNYRGHGGLFGTQHTAMPLNQVIYGLIAGEWHENHHAYPRSARSGLLWWQVDVPYWLIKLMSLCGGIVRYNSPAKETSHSDAELEQPVSAGS
jgi:fatty-acid desaturase